MYVDQISSASARCDTREVIEFLCWSDSGCGCRSTFPLSLALWDGAFYDNSKFFFIQWLINWFLPNLVRLLKPARRHVQYILPLSHIVSSPNIWIYYQIWTGILDYFCVFFVLRTRCWKRWRLTGWCPKCGHSLTVVVVLLRLNVDILFRVHVTCDMWRARVKVKTLSARHVHQVLKQIFGINVINHNSAKCELNFFVY